MNVFKLIKPLRILKKKISLSLLSKEYIFTQKNYRYFIIILRKYQDISIYLQLFSNALNSKKITSKKEIYYHQKLKFSCTIKSAKKLVNGNLILKKRFANYSILLFKTVVGGYSAKLMMHFYKNSLFLYNYTFTNLNEDDKKYIKTIIEEKYLGYKPKFNASKQVIIDNNSNAISIEDNLYFTINYISLKHPVFNELKNNEIEQEKNKIKKEELKKEELFNKL